MLSMNFSERIKLAMREADDMSQAELARQAGVTRAAVVHWMRCEDVSYPLKGEALLEAAKALRVSPYWLYRGEGPMRQSMVDLETRQLLDAFQRLPAKAKLTAVAQIKELADLTSEKVNSVTAEKSGTIGHQRPDIGHGRNTDVRRPSSSTRTLTKGPPCAGFFAPGLLIALDTMQAMPFNVFNEHNGGDEMPANPNLIRFIQSHGNPVVDNRDGTLTVTSIAVDNGIASEVKDTIPATLGAARDLLGY